MSYSITVVILKFLVFCVVLTPFQKIIFKITSLSIMKISINVTEKEMDAIEDVFFCELSEKEYKKVRPILLRFWGKLCNEMDKDK